MFFCLMRDMAEILLTNIWDRWLFPEIHYERTTTSSSWKRCKQPGLSSFLGSCSRRQDIDLIVVHSKAENGFETWKWWWIHPYFRSTKSKRSLNLWVIIFLNVHLSYLNCLQCRNCLMQWSKNYQMWSTECLQDTFTKTWREYFQRSLKWRSYFGEWSKVIMRPVIQQV